MKVRLTAAEKARSGITGTGFLKDNKNIGCVQNSSARNSSWGVRNLHLHRLGFSLLFGIFLPRG